MSYGQFQLRRDTAANWTSANPTLLAGEWGMETDTLAIKLGDGSTVWTSLVYYSTKIRTGAGAPSGGTGVNGDLYYDTTNTKLYGPKAAGAWGSGTSLTGPAGPTGPTGPAGAVNTVAAADGSVTVAGTTNVTVSRAALTGDVTASGGSNVTTVAAVQGQPVSTTSPIVGQSMMYQSGGWTATTDRFDIRAFGADNTGNSDTTLAIYNAIISSVLTRNNTTRATTTGQVTCTGTFSISVTANTLASGTNTIVAQTTTGGIKIQYTGGGGTTTLTGCTVTAGTSGGILLSGSIIGVQANTGGATYPQGGEIFFPSGAYLLAYPIIIPWHGVKLLGATGVDDSDVGSIVGAGGSIVYWTGAVGATMVSYNPTMSGQQAIQGAHVENIYLNCAYVAATGLQMISCHEWYQKGVLVQAPILRAFEFNSVIASWLGGAEAEDCTRGTAISTSYRCVDGSPGTNTLTTTSTAVLNTFTGSQSLALSGTPSGWPTTNGVIIVEAINQPGGAVMHYLLTYGGGGNTSTLTSVTALPLFANSAEETSTSNFLPTAKFFSGAKVRQAVPANAIGTSMSGSATANACCSSFITCTGKYVNGAGLWMGNSDSNVFVNCVHNLISAGTGAGYDIQGSTLSGASGAGGSSRNNQWISGSAGGGGIILRGTESYSYLQPASTNRWDGMEMANGEPIPVSGTGCHFIWTANGALGLGANNIMPTAVSATAASFTGFIPGTGIIVPPQGFQVGTTIRWWVPLSKTAAGTTFSVAVRYGTTNVFATDTIAIATQALTGTAVADQGAIEVIMTIIGPLGASCAALAQLRLIHNLAITGLSTTGTAGSLHATMTMATFASTSTNPGPAYLNLAVTANAANVFTFLVPVIAEVTKVANP